MVELKQKNILTFGERSDKNIYWVDKWISGPEGSLGVYQSRRVTENVLKQIMNKDMMELKVIETTGTYIQFDVRKEYGSAISSESGNFTFNPNGPIKGIIQKIYHENSVEPTFPASWKRVSGNYTLSVLNIIHAVFAGGTRVEYSITKG